MNSVKMGIGDAIKRLIEVEMAFRTGINIETSRAERDMILQALNKNQITVGLDCDADGVPDALQNPVDIFNVSVTTSCCRIDNRKDTSRAKKKVDEPKPESPPTPIPEPAKIEVTEDTVPAQKKKAGIFSKLVGKG